MGLFDSIKGIASGLVSHIPGVGLAGEVASHIPGLQGVGSFLEGNGGNNALMLAQGANAVYNGKKAGDLSDAALKSVTDAFNANAPLRDAGRAQMLHPEAVVASKLASIPQGFNPYAQPQAPAIGPAAGPQASPLARFNPPAGGPALGPAVPRKAFLPGGAA